MDAVQEYTGCNHVSGENFHFAICNPVVRLVDGGKTWFLEWHHYFGPIACNRHGDPLPKCPGPRSRFWLLAQLWKDQGCRVVGGVGVWEMPQRIKTGERLKVGRNLYDLSNLEKVGVSVTGGALVEVWECVGYEGLIPMELRPKGRA